MKNVLLLFALMILNSGLAARLTINWTYTHVVKGYDHDNRIEVFIDGKPAGTSEVYRQTANGTMTIDFPDGEHRLRVVGHARYEGKWEEHIRANDYSLDAVVEETFSLQKDAKYKIEFDIKEETATGKLIRKQPKAKKPRAKNTFTVSWDYLNVVEGYDHDARMVVYIDGKREFVSQVSPETQGGTLTFKLPAGSHDVRFQTEVLYEGNWEEQRKDNGYSIDAFHSVNNLNATSRTNLKLTFDISKETTDAELK